MKGKLLTSALLSSGAQSISKLISLLSTFIIARILTPDQFGLIAIISLTIYFFDTLSNAGSQQYLMQKKCIDQADLNTAWSLDILTKSFVVLTLILTAPLLASFFQQEQLVKALPVAALVLIFRALTHPKIMLLKKQLNYGPLFKLTLFEKIVTFVFVILGAMTFRNFWAFIIADLVSSLTTLLISYTMFRSNPKWSTSKISTQWLFSKWLLAKSILGYSRAQIDTILVSRFFSATILGHYHMARDIAMLPAHTFLAPAIEPLLVAFRSASKATQELDHKFSQSLLITSLLCAPITVFVGFYSDLIITVLLGPQWEGAADLLAVFSLLFWYWVVLLMIEQAFIAIGKVNIVFWLDLVSLVVTVCILLIAIFQQQNIVDIAIARAITGIVFTLIALLLFLQLNRFSITLPVTYLIWPLLLSLIIVKIQSYFSPEIDNIFLHLLFDGVTFVITATTFTFLTLRFSLNIRHHRELYNYCDKFLKTRFKRITPEP